MNYRPLSSPQPLGKVLSNGMELLRETFARVAGLALVGAAIANAPRLLASQEAKDPLVWLRAATAGERLMELATLAWMLATQLINMVLLLAVIARMRAVAGGADLRAVSALALAMKRAPAFLLVLVMFTAAIVVGVGVVVVLAAAAATAIGPDGAPVETLFFGFLLLFMLALALPLAVPLAYWYFAFFLVVTEHKRAVAALGRSFALVRGQLWRVKGALSVVFCVALAAVLLVESVAMAAGAALPAGTLAGDLTAFAILALGNAAIAPLPIAASLALLSDLTRRHDARVRSLGAQRA